jgi:hypothetical protein
MSVISPDRGFRCPPPQHHDQQFPYRRKFGNRNRCGKHRIATTFGKVSPMDLAGMNWLSNSGPAMHEFSPC